MQKQITELEKTLLEIDKIKITINDVLKMLKQEQSVTNSNQIPVEDVNNWLHNNENNGNNNRPFDLESFVTNAKNQNVRDFYYCRIVEGNSRTKTVYSAIGSLTQAGCSREKILELSEKYCKETLLEINKIANILNKIK